MATTSGVQWFPGTGTAATALVGLQLVVVASTSPSALYIISSRNPNGNQVKSHYEQQQQEAQQSSSSRDPFIIERFLKSIDRDEKHHEMRGVKLKGRRARYRRRVPMVAEVDGDSGDDDNDHDDVDQLDEQQQEDEASDGSMDNIQAHQVKQQRQRQTKHLASSASFYHQPKNSQQSQQQLVQRDFGLNDYDGGQGSLNQQAALPGSGSGSIGSTTTTATTTSTRIYNRPRNKKPVYVSINQQTVNGLLSLLLLFIVSICGTVGAIFIISSLTVIESLQTRGNCYLVSLALAHLLVTLLVIPTSALQIMAGDGIDGRQLCHYQWLTLEFSLIVSQLSFLLIAADNYLGYKSTEKVTTIANTNNNNNNSTDASDCPLLMGQSHQELKNSTTPAARSTLNELPEMPESCQDDNRPLPVMLQQPKSINHQQIPLMSKQQSSSINEHFSNLNNLRFIVNCWQPLGNLQKYFKCLDSNNNNISNNNRRQNHKIRLAHQFADRKGTKLERPGCFSYRNCCGKLRVLFWIVSIWLVALVCTFHQHELRYGANFCPGNSVQTTTSTTKTAKQNLKSTINKTSSSQIVAQNSTLDKLSALNFPSQEGNNLTHQNRSKRTKKSTSDINQFTITNPTNDIQVPKQKPLVLINDDDFIQSTEVKMNRSNDQRNLLGLTTTKGRELARRRKAEVELLPSSAGKVRSTARSGELLNDDDVHKASTENGDHYYHQHHQQQQQPLRSVGRIKATKMLDGDLWFGLDGKEENSWKPSDGCGSKGGCFDKDNTRVPRGSGWLEHGQKDKAPGKYNSWVQKIDELVAFDGSLARSIGHNRVSNSPIATAATSKSKNSQASIDELREGILNLDLDFGPIKLSQVKRTSGRGGGNKSRRPLDKHGQEMFEQQFEGHYDHTAVTSKLLLSDGREYNEEEPHDNDNNNEMSGTAQMLSHMADSEIVPTVGPTDSFTSKTLYDSYHRNKVPPPTAINSTEGNNSSSNNSDELDDESHFRSWQSGLGGGSKCFGREGEEDCSYKSNGDSLASGYKKKPKIRQLNGIAVVVTDKGQLAAPKFKSVGPAVSGREGRAMRLLSVVSLEPSSVQNNSAKTNNRHKLQEDDHYAGTKDSSFEGETLDQVAIMASQRNSLNSSKQEQEKDRQVATAAIKWPKQLDELSLFSTPHTSTLLLSSLLLSPSAFNHHRRLAGRRNPVTRRQILSFKLMQSLAPLGGENFSFHPYWLDGSFRPKGKFGNENLMNNDDNNSNNNNANNEPSRMQIIVSRPKRATATAAASVSTQSMNLDSTHSTHGGNLVVGTTSSQRATTSGALATEPNNDTTKFLNDKWNAISISPSANQSLELDSFVGPLWQTTNAIPDENQMMIMMSNSTPILLANNDNLTNFEIFNHPDKLSRVIERKADQLVYYWLIICSTVLGPTLISAILFLRAWFKMKIFKMRPYKPMPVGALNSAMSSLLVSPISPLPVIPQHQVYTYPEAQRNLGQLKLQTKDRTDDLHSPIPLQQQDQEFKIPKNSPETTKAVQTSNFFDEHNRRSVSQPSGNQVSTQIAAQADKVTSVAAATSAAAVEANDFGSRSNSVASNPIYINNNTNSSQSQTPLTAQKPPMSPTNLTHHARQQLNQVMSAPIGYNHYVQQQQQLYRPPKPLNMALNNNNNYGLCLAAYHQGSAQNSSDYPMNHRLTPLQFNESVTVMRETFSSPPSATFRHREFGDELFSMNESQQQQQQQLVTSADCQVNGNVRPAASREDPAGSLNSSSYHNHHQQQQQPARNTNEHLYYQGQQQPELADQETTASVGRRLSPIQLQPQQQQQQQQPVQQYEFRRRQNHAQSFHYGSSSMHHYRSQHHDPSLNGQQLTGSQPAALPEPYEPGQQQQVGLGGIVVSADGIDSVAASCYSGFQTLCQQPEVAAAITEVKQKQQQQHLFERHRSLPRSSRLYHNSDNHSKQHSVSNGPADCHMDLPTSDEKLANRTGASAGSSGRQMRRHRKQQQKQQQQRASIGGQICEIGATDSTVTATSVAAVAASISGQVMDGAQIEKAELQKQQAASPISTALANIIKSMDPAREQQAGHCDGRRDSVQVAANLVEKEFRRHQKSSSRAMEATQVADDDDAADDDIEHSKKDVVKSFLSASSSSLNADGNNRNYHRKSYNSPSSFVERNANSADCHSKKLGNPQGNGETIARKINDTGNNNNNKAILCTYSHMTDDQLLQSNIIVFIVNLTLWLPFILLSIVAQYRDLITQELKDSVWWLATLNCCSCSYVYAITNKDFREAFNKLFYYCCCKSHVTFQRKTPIFRRQLDLDSSGTLRIHIIPGLNVYSNKLSKGDHHNPTTLSLGVSSNLAQSQLHSLNTAAAASLTGSRQIQQQHQQSGIISHQTNGESDFPLTSAADSSNPHNNNNNNNNNQHHHLRHHHMSVGGGFGGPLFGSGAKLYTSGGQAEMGGGGGKTTYGRYCHTTSPSSSGYADRRRFQVGEL